MLAGVTSNQHKKVDKELHATGMVAAGGKGCLFPTHYQQPRKRSPTQSGSSRSIPASEPMINKCSQRCAQPARPGENLISSICRLPYRKISATADGTVPNKGFFFLLGKLVFLFLGSIFAILFAIAPAQTLLHAHFYPVALHANGSGSGRRKHRFLGSAARNWKRIKCKRAPIFQRTIKFLAGR